MSFTSPEQTAAAVQDQPVTPDPASATPQAPPAAPATPPPSTGPWAQDLANLFPDEATRGQVDQFLREKVQPYTTRLEQQGKTAEQALSLWQQFEQNPVDTYVAVTHELYGEEAANTLLQTLQTTLQGAQAPAPPATPQAPEQPASDPRVAQMIDWWENQQSTDYYTSQIERLAQENPDLARKLDEANPASERVVDFIHPFVAAAEGDFDAAAQAFREYNLRFGVPQGTPAAPPPAVLGSDSNTATTGTPTQKQYTSNDPLGEALSDFMDEQRAARQAPPVAG